MEHSEASASALGAVISRHGRSRANVLGLILGIVLPLIAIVVPWLLLNSPHFDQSAKPMLIKTALGLFALGIGMLLLWKFNPPHDVLTLHERGIVRQAKSGETTIVPFEDIMDIYQFRTGNQVGGMINAMAIRRSANDPWISILDNRRGAFDLRGAITYGQINARLPIALNQLESGHSIRFHAIDNGERLVKRVTGSVFKINPKPLELSARGIDVDGRHIPLDTIHAVTGVEGVGQIKLLDENGATLYAVHYLSLFSADFFAVLLEGLMEARRPAYEHLMAH